MAIRSSQKISLIAVPGQTRRFYKFGPFGLDPHKRLLLRENDPVSLTPKALETLIVLVENRDGVVSKDDLMKTLWPDSVVEESNLSQNIFTLRKALGDSAQRSRYILTVPGRGYQFVEAVRETRDRKAPEALPLAIRSRRPLALVLLVLAIGAGVAWWFAWLARRPEAPPQWKQRRLTANPAEQPVTHAAISPDGKYLGYSDQRGLHLELADTGQAQTLRLPSAARAERAVWDFESWYPDATRFVARLAASGKPASLWSVPLRDGTPRELIGDAYGESRVSPDGSSIAFLRVPVFLENSIGDPYTLGAREIWLMGPRGESPHRIIAADDLSGFERLAWSPAGDRIVYKYWHQRGDTVRTSIESNDLKGASQATIFSNDRLKDFTWVSSGRLIYSQNVESKSSDYSADNLWELRLDPKKGTRRGAPHRLTDWSGFSVTGLNATADGKSFTFLRSARHDSVLVGDLTDNGNRLLHARQLAADDHSNIPLAWTRDSQRVIFVSRRTQALQIYSQAVDGATPPQLLTSAPAIDFEAARLAPDSAFLIARGKPRGAKTEAFYRVPIEGGVPQLIFAPKGEICGDFRCANEHANFCAYQIQTPDHKELIIQSFDPILGKGNELLRIPVEPGGDYHWSLSPDGAQVGLLKSEWGSNQIRFLNVRGGESRSIPVAGYAELRSLDWAPDSKSVFVGSSGPEGSSLLHVDLSGKAQTIWRQPQPLNTWGVASPDGRRLAMFGTSVDANVWMIEQF